MHDKGQKHFNFESSQSKTKKIRKNFNLSFFEFYKID